MIDVNRNASDLGHHTWRGSLFLWKNQSFYIGAASDSDVHSTHYVTVSVAMHGAFRLFIGGRWRTFKAAIIPPDVPHIFDGRGAHLILLYFPSELLGSKRIMFPGDEAYAVSARMLQRFRPCLNNYLDNGCETGEATELCKDFISELSSNDFPRLGLDHRVMRALECFQADPTHRFTAAEISSEVSLSASRFAHLFSEQIGVPVRSYLLELRLRHALLQVARGDSLTDGAYAAGFADSAHLSRTFRRTTGIAPSSLLKYSRCLAAEK